MALLDVNALVALAWDSHIHHAAMRAWFKANSSTGWATCPITEGGFVRISSNPIVLPSAIGIDTAREVIAKLRSHPGHHFLTDDVSMSDSDMPVIAGYRQVTDAHLLMLARRHSMRLVTFDASILAIGNGKDVEVLTAL